MQHSGTHQSASTHHHPAILLTTTGDHNLRSSPGSTWWTMPLLFGPCNTLCHVTRTRVHRCPGHILCRTTGHISNAHMLPLSRYQWSLAAVLTRLSDCIPVSSPDGSSAATSTYANIHTNRCRMIVSGHACVRMQSICRHTTHIRHARTHIVGKGLTITAVLAQKPAPPKTVGQQG